MKLCLSFLTFTLMKVEPGEGRGDGRWAGDAREAPGARLYWRERGAPLAASNQMSHQVRTGLLGLTVIGVILYSIVAATL